MTSSEDVCRELHLTIVHDFIDWDEHKNRFVITIGLERQPTGRTPTEQEWSLFWTIVDTLDVWNSDAWYEANNLNELVCDGSPFSVELRNGDKSLKASGNLAARSPRNWDLLERAVWAMAQVPRRSRRDAEELEDIAKLAAVFAIAATNPHLVADRLKELLKQKITWR